jgi:hypothetical protein
MPLVIYHPFSYKTGGVWGGWRKRESREKTNHCTGGFFAVSVGKSLAFLDKPAPTVLIPNDQGQLTNPKSAVLLEEVQGACGGFAKI